MAPTTVRRGSVTLEFLLVLPLCVVIALAVYQFGHSLLVAQAVSHASIAAARTAGKDESLDEVAAVVDHVLEGTHGVDLLDGGGSPVANSGVRVVLEVGQPDAAGRPAWQSLGDATVSCAPPASGLSDDEVRVTVCVTLAAARVRNLLNQFIPTAVNFDGKKYQLTSVAKKE